jgi:1-acyl-sn-glycerol-3-phosphate acyltransferase
MARRLIATLRTVIAVPTFFLFTVGISALVWVVVIIRPHHPFVEKIINLWSRLFLSIAPVTYEVEGRDRLDPGRQYVFVANHLSNFDIPVLFLSIAHAIRYMAKKELFAIPAVGSAMKRIGIIRIDRGAGPSTHASINAGVTAAKEHGYSLIVFPEGTRSRDGGLHEFKKGAFRIAIASGLDVVPVALRGTWEVWQPDHKVFFPGHARVRIGEPISVADLTLSDIDGLRERTHATIAKAFAELG